MPYDNSRIFRPDLQPDLPSWVDMGEPEQPNVTPFVDALKKRMAANRTAATSTGSVFSGAKTAGERPTAGRTQSL